MEKILVCEQCSKEFVAKDYRENRPAKYCSRKCAGQAKRKYDTYEVTCQQCGNVFDNSHYPGRKAKFCNPQCWGEYQKENPVKRSNKIAKPKVKTNCRFCNKIIYRSKSSIRKWDRHYCSVQCRIDDGWNQPDPSKKSIFTCKWCQKEFEEWAYRQPTFCSNQCRSEYGARQPKPNARTPQNYLTMQCESCGEEYKIHKCIIENPNRNTRFCSIECRAIAMSKERMGENNPNFVHGLSHLYPGRGKNWQSQRKRAIRRDKRTCQVCKKTKNGLDVHHIIPYVNFEDNWKEANKLSNLITLCRQCHVKVERGKIPCPLPNARRIAH